MIRINLLREGHGKRRGGAGVSTAAITAPAEGAPPWGIFAAILILVLLGTLAWGGWLMMQNRGLAVKIAAQRKKLESYKKVREKVKNLEKKKKEYAAKVAQLKKLKDQQSLPVMLMNRLVEVLPEGAWYDKVNQDTKGVKLKGKAKNIKAISTLYDNLVADKVFSGVELGTVQQAGGGDVYTYQLTMKYNPQTGAKKPAPDKG